MQIKQKTSCSPDNSALASDAYSKRQKSSDVMASENLESLCVTSEHETNPLPLTLQHETSTFLPLDDETTLQPIANQMKPLLAANDTSLAISI